MIDAYVTVMCYLHVAWIVSENTADVSGDHAVVGVVRYAGCSSVVVFVQVVQVVGAPGRHLARI